MYKVTVPVTGETAYKYKEKTLYELKRCKADRVAIALDTFFEHTFPVQYLKELITYFEENQLEVLVWINTLGHDRINSPDKEGPYDYIEYMQKGKVNSFCPMGKPFLEYYIRTIAKIVNCGAKMIMLDDDFRMGLGFGCCCDMHMEAFCKELQENVTKEELLDKLLKGGKNKYRSAWLKVQGDGLRNFARELRNAVDRINPEVRMGACVTMGRWDADGADAIEIAKILAGKTKPFIRTFGAPYHATLRFLGNEIEEERFLGNVIEKVRTQLKWCEKEDIELFAEGDTYPRPRFSCPSSMLECYDMILRADGQADGILKYLIDYTSSPEYETGYIDSMVKNEKLYQEIECMFAGKHAIGVRPYLVQRTIEGADLNCDKLDNPRRIDGLAFDECSAYELLTSNCIPCTYEETAVKVVFGESARHIPAEDMQGGMIIDLVAAKCFMERGIDVGIASIDESRKLFSDNIYDMACEYYMDEDETVKVSTLEISKIEHKDGVKILTKYQKGAEEWDFVYEYENKDGQKFLVFPFVARSAVDKKGIFKSYSRRRMLLKSIERMGNLPLKVHPDGNYPMLYTLVKENDNGLSAGMWNLFADKIEKAKIKVNTPFTDIQFVNCHGHTEQDTIIIDSVLYPYEFAGFELRYDGTSTQ